MALAPTTQLLPSSKELNGTTLTCQTNGETTTLEGLAKRDLASENLAISCADCHTKKTPLWRRAENGDILCNACGLFTKTKRVRRTGCKSKAPEAEDIEVAPSQVSKGTCPGDGNCNGTGGARACDGCPAYHQQNDTKKKLSCFNCHTITTPLWRRDGEGNNICNACGLYYKINNSHRPVTLKTAVIKRRRRMVAPKDKNHSPTNELSGEPHSPDQTTESVREESVPEVPSIEDYPDAYFNQDRVHLPPPRPVPPPRRLQFARPRVVLTLPSEEPNRISKPSSLSPVDTSDSVISPYHRPCPGTSARHPTPTHSPPASSDRTAPLTHWSPVTSLPPSTSTPYPSRLPPTPAPAPPVTSTPAPVVDVNNLLAERAKIQLEIDTLTQHLNNSSAVLHSMKNVLQSIDLILASQPPSSSVPPPTLPPSLPPPPPSSRSTITLPSIQYLTSASYPTDVTSSSYSRPYYYHPPPPPTTE